MISINNLNISIGANTVVDNVSLQIRSGETLGLVGESGSGKSMTALTIMRLLPKVAKVNNGSIFFEQKELLSLTQKEMCDIRGKNIAMIFQEPMTALNPSLRCGHQVDEILKIHSNIKSKDTKAYTLERFAEVLMPNPEEAYNKYPHQLSGGQLQRVMIAMVISCKPQLLIADEPTTALDVTVQREVLMLLKSLQRRYGMGMLFVSHDLNVVSAICENIAVMQHGKIVEQGASKNILTNPQNFYTQHLISCRNSVAAEKQKSKTGKILDVKDLTATFITKKSLLGKPLKSFPAVNNISFELYKGETLGLVGESGSGKSTLGRSIMQLIDSKSENIIFNGINVNHAKGNELKLLRKQMQLVFQDPYSSLNPRLSIGHAIEEPIAVHGIASGKEARENALVLLKKVGLGSKYYSRFPHELSGGQRQRVVIARALAVNPQILICDESFSALDVSIQAQVLQLLNQMKKEFDLSYIFISHDLAVVRQMSDRIMVMQHGNLVEINTADNLFENPQKEYTKRLIAAKF
jgi:peptide/nickel transport system ATP-binding protein